jgi:hypothetical protein
MRDETTPCGALTRSGASCRRPAIRGGTRCTHHGGDTPHARRKANENLAVAGNIACEYLRDLIAAAQEDACEVCGRSSADPSPIIRAAQIVLDRSGFHPTMNVQVGKVPAYEEWVAWMTDDELTQVQLCILNAKQRMAAGEPRQDTLPTIEANAVLVESTDPEQGSSPVGAEPKE